MKPGDLCVIVRDPINDNPIDAQLVGKVVTLVEIDEIISGTPFWHTDPPATVFTSKYTLDIVGNRMAPGAHVVCVSQRNLRLINGLGTCQSNSSTVTDSSCITASR